MVEIVVINGAELSAAQRRWMFRLATGDMLSIAEAAEKIDMLPRTREGCNVLLSWLYHMDDCYGYEVLVTDFWDLLTETERRMIVGKVQVLFCEEIQCEILCHLDRDERKLYMEDLSDGVCDE